MCAVFADAGLGRINLIARAVLQRRELYPREELTDGKSEV